ncbi:uncharacterized protein Bfra_001019, partial [Botrytis fragariae]
RCLLDSYHAKHDGDDGAQRQLTRLPYVLRPLNAKPVHTATIISSFKKNMERQGTHKSLTSQSETNTKRYPLHDIFHKIGEDGAQETYLSVTRERSTPISMVCCAPSSQSETNTISCFFAIIIFDHWVNLKVRFEQMRGGDWSGPPRSYQPQVVPRLSASNQMTEMTPLYDKPWRSGSCHGGVGAGSLQLPEPSNNHRSRGSQLLLLPSLIHRI